MSSLCRPKLGQHAQHACEAEHCELEAADAWMDRQLAKVCAERCHGQGNVCDIVCFAMLVLKGTQWTAAAMLHICIR